MDFAETGEKQAMYNLLYALEGINDRSYVQKETEELYKLLAELKENTLLFNTVETTLEAINSTSYYEGIIVGARLYRLLVEKA